MATITADDVKQKFGDGYVGYDDLVRMACGTILVEESIGDRWSGDGHFLVKNEEGQYGHVVLGYGSCSHCDHMEWCRESEDPHKAFADFANEIANVMWKDKAEMLTYLKEHDAKGSWYGGGEDWKSFQKECFDALKA